ncbi:hypothetical protein GOEFS_064_00230 [Gordonia effusa NBRC 100432]|uniref:Hydrolase n=1 Tax=Gordonia effusa NBRC 100432 TaxID=1077974 RepID=H0R133_9ACTN|nr:hypothetical protein [Gordonia effusa]GAB18784.1 hypothetical protein GOEFS_064_00230 [Gordonia effusa NBRC 100432]
MKKLLIVVLTLATAFISLSAVAAPAAAKPTTPFDLCRVPTAKVDTFTLLVGYAFGNRLPEGADPDRAEGLPGPVNEALADTLIRVRGTRNIPIYAQKPIADVLTEKYGAENIIVITSRVKPDGTLEYLSTDGVAAVVAKARAETIRSDRAGVIAFSDHLWRAVYTSVANGLSAYAPSGVKMPSTYDKLSGQAWTRDRMAYLWSDYQARPAIIARVLGAR